VRAQAQNPRLAEMVAAQQSLQLRSAPKLVLTPMAALSSTWKGRRSRQEETLHSDMWGSCGHSCSAVWLSFDKPSG